MSQFMLCESKEDLTNLFCISLFSTKTNKIFLENIAIDFFGKAALENIWVVEYIDKYCIKAWQEMNGELDFEATRLCEILSNLYLKSNRLMMWYGDEHQDLEKVESMAEFINCVKEQLKDSMCELYICKV